MTPSLSAGSCDACTRLEGGHGTTVQPKASTEMNVTKDQGVSQPCENCSHQHHDHEAQRLRGGGAAKDLLLSMCAIFMCFECCEGCCGCIADVICCPCEVCC